MFETRLHWTALFRPVRRSALLLAFAGLVACFFSLSWMWIVVPTVSYGVILRIRLWLSERVTLTSRELCHRRGVPETGRKESSFLVDRLAGCTYTRTPMGKLFGYCRVSLLVRGARGFDIHPFPYDALKVGALNGAVLRGAGHNAYE